ncbi:MAG TPA: SRPBCC family protein [Frankiaceae bacterium]|nr:SRPBCC family protein [Frankiaceae bacterium]
MQLENSFTVPASPEEAWAVLLDVERVAPCMPGATLTGHDGDNFQGTVKVKVGPIAVSYRGTAAFVDRDDATHTVKIDAKGRETRGSGTANAKINCKLTPDGDGTRVEVITDLAITGKPAQFGRGVIGEVAGKVITQFADALAEEISSGTPTPAAAEPAVEPAAEPVTDSEPVAAPQASSAPEPTAEPGPVAPAAAPAPPRERRSAEAIDLLDVAGAPVAKRLAPLVAFVALLLVFVTLRRRKS